MSKKSKYPDPLETRLDGPPVQVGCDNYEAKKQEYDLEKKRRFDLLMRHYEIDPQSKVAWQHLAIRLAEDHVPGLKPWRPSIDPGRHIAILTRMLYMTKIRGFTEKSAAAAICEVRPDLGDAESIRSIFREQHLRPGLKALPRFFERIESQAGSEKLKDFLEEEIEPDLELLRQAEKPKRGRPKKK
ncbi:MAG: hypothetical protein ACX93P_15330 [Roseovarius sp.]